MTVTYNHDRSLDQRHKRYNELLQKRCVPSEAKYVVITTRAGADGDFTAGHGDVRYYFKHRATAIAWAQQYSDICDHVAGVFKMFEFIRRVDVR